MPSMTTERSFYDMIYLQQKVWAVGGRGGTKAIESMDIYDVNSGIWTKQSIPFSVERHCVAELSPNQFIVIGGWGVNSVSENTT